MASNCLTFFEKATCDQTESKTETKTDTSILHASARRNDHKTVYLGTFVVWTAGEGNNLFTEDILFNQGLWGTCMLPKLQA